MTEALAIARDFGPWVALAAVLTWTILRERMADRAELREVKAAHVADLRLQLPALQRSADADTASREALDRHSEAITAMADRLASLERDVERVHAIVAGDRHSTDPGPPPSRRGR